jgi:hypothetical protein
MDDRFADRAGSYEGPASVGFAITPGSADLPEITRAIYVGSGGDLAVEMASGQQVTFKSVYEGTLLPIRVRKVLSASTAGYILGLS